MVDFINAAPAVYDNGTKDQSSSTQIFEPLNLPQHLPKVYIWAEKGKVGPSYVDVSEYSLKDLYGESSFDTNNIFYNQSTAFLEKFAENSNNCIVHRLYKESESNLANVTLSLDVTFIPNVPLYQKNSNGTRVLDGSGNFIPTGVTVNGFEVTWIATHVGENSPPDNGDTVRYPIFEFRASSFGKGGNKVGFSLFPRLRTDHVNFPDDFMETAKNYPYSFSLKKIVNEETGKTAIVSGNFSTSTSTFVLEKRKQQASSGLNIDAATVLSDSYVKYFGDNNKNEIGDIKVFNENIDIVTKLFYDTESSVPDTNRDLLINGSVGNEYCMNIIGFTSSNGLPYNTIKMVSAPGGVHLSKDSIVMLKGGSNGLMPEAKTPEGIIARHTMFDALVKEDLLNYSDPMHEYMDLVLHPESHMYDTGFSLETKLAMTKFISRRRDTYVVLSSYSWDKNTIDGRNTQTQISLAQSLQSVFKWYPESVIFGTQCMRASVVVGSCLLINSLCKERLPVSIEVAIKSAKYMGNSNGRWNRGLIFDSQPGSLLTEINDVDITWVPAAVRNTLWASGIIFTNSFSVRQRFLTAMRTVYSDDTSVLNSYFTAVAICYLNKIEHAAWRRFTGNISLSPAAFIDAMNRFIMSEVSERFDKQFMIIPDCKITSFDKKRGYSWTINIKIGSNSMTTVATTSVEAYRSSDLLNSA